MPRYFLEVAYRGENYSGFQVQKNANTIQAEVEKALSIFYKKSYSLTGSSRTDAGVHAYQNFFHFDAENEISDSEKDIYNLNALLPPDIVVKNFFRVKDNAHCRFDAVLRGYKYFIYHKKNPFVKDTAFFYPYTLDLEKMKIAANLILQYEDFSSFSKKKTQVKNFNCKISCSEWLEEEGILVYHVESNRFLRGMVKGLVGTMLRVGRGIITLNDFQKIIESKDRSNADFSVPSHGLFLVKVVFGEPLRDEK
ncbi:MAG: tRNA pseudouridine(38-40) synthase TruA [Chitinophagaceae bacterium]|nr:tRNA pseudouridine(38-40) synthase TruA [Chitinophagaceae bacterium]